MPLPQDQCNSYRLGVVFAAHRGRIINRDRLCDPFHLLVICLSLKGKMSAFICNHKSGHAFQFYGPRPQLSFLHLRSSNFPVGQPVGQALRTLDSGTNKLETKATGEAFVENLQRPTKWCAKTWPQLKELNDAKR